MFGYLFLVVATLAALWALGRVLLGLEARGWINYRRNGLSRGGSTYHRLELQSIFDPSARELMEVTYGQEQHEDESGAPPSEDVEPDGTPENPE